MCLQLNWGVRRTPTPWFTRIMTVAGVSGDQVKTPRSPSPYPRPNDYRGAHLMLTPMTPPLVAPMIVLVTKTRQFLALSVTTYP